MAVLSDGSFYMSELEKQREALLHKSFTMMFRVLLVFGIPAVASYFIGKWLDGKYDIRPWGSVSVLAVTFVGSWVAVIIMYLKLDKEMRELRHKEEEQENKKIRNQESK